MTQTTENNFRLKIKKFGIFTISKIQVNPYACTSEKGDFLIQSFDKDIIVECKEVLMNNRKTKPRFSIDRFSQEYKLNLWVNQWKRNKGFLFLNFWNRTKIKSSTFLIPIKDWLKIKKQFKTKTLKEEDALIFFKKYKLESNWNDLRERLND